MTRAVTSFFFFFFKVRMNESMTKAQYLVSREQRKSYMADQNYNIRDVPSWFGAILPSGPRKG